VKHTNEELALIVEGCRNLGYHLPPEALSRFRTYTDLLRSWNRRINLFSRRDEAHLVLRHILPSLAPLAVLPKGPLRVMDIGSGAGFPGLPLKIVRGEISIALVESKRLRALFLRRVVEELALEGVQVIQGRAEVIAQGPAHRGAYDWAIARAVADLSTLLRYVSPFLRERGGLIAYKSLERAERELMGWDIRWEAYRISVHPSSVPVALVVIRSSAHR